MKNGLFLVDKKENITSFDTINALKRKLSLEKVGHSGTLDKFASGLLLVFSGKYSKVVDAFLKMDKIYESTMEFGYMTNTLDRNGVVCYDGKSYTDGKIPSLEEIKSVLPSFIGNIKQAPPKFSRVSIDGKRAYQKVQGGEDFEMPEKNITIYDIKINNYENGKLSFTTHCASGTYIRSLGRDIAIQLGTYGTIIQLNRTKIGDISINDAKYIEDIDLNDSKNFLDYLSGSKLIELNEEQKVSIDKGIHIKNFLYDSKKLGSYIGIYKNEPIAMLKNDLDENNKPREILRYSKLN